ncbi:MAG: hypothetical protein ACXWX8_05650, partial [Candidatus Binatia bacterium]
IKPALGKELPGNHQPRAGIAARFLARAESEEQEEDTEEKKPAIELPLCLHGLHDSRLKTF